MDGLMREGEWVEYREERNFKFSLGRLPDCIFIYF